jgi:hypothetical protein
LSVREDVLQAHHNLLNGSGKLGYFEHRGLSKEILKQAFMGYQAGAFTYPSIGKNGGLLGVHHKSETRDVNGKRKQWWQGYAEDLPPKGHGKKPDAPAKVIPFGMETLEPRAWLSGGSMLRGGRYAELAAGRLHFCIAARRGSLGAGLRQRVCGIRGGALLPRWRRARGS